MKRKDKLAYKRFEETSYIPEIGYELIKYK